jgi:hypothetical protein
MAHGDMRDGVVHQVRSGLRHAPRTARRAEAWPLAAKGDQLATAAVTTARAQKAVGQDGALEEGVELVFDELRQIGLGGGFGFGEEGSVVLMRQGGTAWSVGAVSLAVDQRAVRRPPRLPADG